MFCPDGISQTIAGSYQNSVSLPLTGINLETGAVRIQASIRLGIAFGDSMVVATATDLHKEATPEAEIYKVPAGATHIAFFQLNGDGDTIYVTVGQKV